MNRGPVCAPISPGWALVAILLLWGLAGALDQPPGDAEPSPGLVIDQAAPAEPLVHLRCHFDPDGPGAQPPRHERGAPLISLVSLRESQGDRYRQLEWPSRSLRCFVIDE